MHPSYSARDSTQSNLHREKGSSQAGLGVGRKDSLVRNTHTVCPTGESVRPCRNGHLLMLSDNRKSRQASLQPSSDNCPQTSHHKGSQFPLASIFCDHPMWQRCIWHLPLPRPFPQPRPDFSYYHTCSWTNADSLISSYYYAESCFEYLCTISFLGLYLH